MTILQDIKLASLSARKSHDAERAAALTTLLSEATMIGKNDGNRDTTDTETIAVIKKFIKNIDETLEVLSVAGSNREITVKLSREKAELVSFLPKQLSEAEIVTTLKNIVRENNIALSPKSMGEMLKLLKAQHEGTYDGATAARVTKEIVASGVL
jgi:hypothetical protein